LDNRINEAICRSMEQKFYELDYNKKSRNISHEDLLSKEEIEGINEINELRTEMLKESSYNLSKSLKSNPMIRYSTLTCPLVVGRLILQ